MPIPSLQTQIAEASGFMEALDVADLHHLLSGAFLDEPSAAKWLAEVEPDFRCTPISLLKFCGEIGTVRVFDYLKSRQRR